MRFRSTTASAMGLAAAVLALLPSGAHASDAKAAKAHLEKGEALVAEGALDQAIVELKLSYSLDPVPLVLYNIGVCFDKLGRRAAASLYYQLYLEAETAGVEGKRKIVESRVKELAKHTGFLEFVSEPSDAELLVDGVPAETGPDGLAYVDTGAHDLTIRCEGYQEMHRTVTIASGQIAEVKVTLVPIEGTTSTQEGMQESSGKPRKGGHPAAFWTMIGLSLTTAAAAVVTGAITLKKNDRIRSMAGGSEEELKDLRHERDDLVLATAILVPVAAASCIAAIALYFFTDFNGKGDNALSLSFPLQTHGAMVFLTASF